MRLRRVAIVGMGQIGGSLGMALLRRKLASRVVGIDRDPSTLRKALRRGACSVAARELFKAAYSDLIVLAVPVRSIGPLALEASQTLTYGGILTDTGSVKVPVTKAFRAASKGCGGRPQFVGGHPMVGNERGGIDAADPDLFEGAPWVLVPGDPTAVRELAGLVSRLGARPELMTAEAHDRAASLASHLPYSIAISLASLAGPRPPLAAGSFRSATRVAAQPLEMSLDILLANRFHIARDIGRMSRRMSRLATLLVKGDEAALRRFIESARP